MRRTAAPDPAPGAAAGAHVPRTGDTSPASSVPGAGTVAAWPRVTAVLRTATTATLIVNDVERPCRAPGAARLRTGVLARTVAVARAVGRPVRLRLSAPGATQLLAVGPDGDVRVLTDDGAVTGEPLPTPDDTGCRRCDAPQPLAAVTCGRCGTLEPHRVELEPFPVLDVAELVQPDAAVAADLHARALPARGGGGPALVVHVEGSAPRTVRGSVALGRNPAAAPGRTPVAVSSPGMLVSKTHVVAEVDADGVVHVTDRGSTNGTTVLTDPPVRLTPGRRHPLPRGAAVRMGDVTVHLEPADPAGTGH